MERICFCWRDRYADDTENYHKLIILFVLQRRQLALQIRVGGEHFCQRTKNAHGFDVDPYPTGA